MRNFLHYLFIILLIFSSCSKDEIEKIVIAGIYDSDFIYHEFSPPLKVELKLDTIADNYFWNDSIDINQDGICELFISQRIHLPPESGSPSSEHFPYFRLTLKNGLQVAIKIEYYALGHGQVDEINWVDAVNYKTRINNNSDWSESNVTKSMWMVPPIGAPGTLPYGTWYNLANEDKYIGIRMEIGSRYKYGWIKVKVISREDMQFLSFALEK
jgi:hypothetical protein